MEFMMTGLLALLGAGELWIVWRLEREIRRQSCRAETRTLLENAEVWRDVLEKLEALPTREESGEALEKLEALMREAPYGGGEDELGRAMQEGITNLLQYAAGKAPGVEARL